jgi:squalene-associated FAD-dependent desaturase
MVFLVLFFQKKNMPDVIIGAGLAGLSAAVALAEAGREVVLYEAGPAAGGRARSYFDRALGCRIDNGNHLLLSGNTAALAYVETIGARGTLAGPGEAFFPFFDVASGESWTLRPGVGRVPWWVLRPARRVPGAGLGEYLKLLALGRARPGATVADVLGGGALYRRLLAPLAVAALNTRPEVALASLLRPVVAQTLLHGGRACVPLYARDGLSESLVDPALVWLGQRGGMLHTGRRVAGLEIAGGRVAGVRLADGVVAVAPDDAVVLAVPPWVATEVLPGLMAPEAFEAIVNLHFRCDAKPAAEVARAGFVGLIGGTAEWAFVRPGIVSVTISAANHLVNLAPEVIAARVWGDLRAVLGLAEAVAPVRVVKEKRATFAATGAQEVRRPGARTALVNLALAGDWTATGLPATIEGAIRSGRSAANVLLARGQLYQIDRDRSI